MTAPPPTTAFPPAVRPRRTIAGHAAVLLPHTAAGSIDWPGFEAHLARTVAAGLRPAVNMDTGYVQLLDDEARGRVLDVAAAVAPGAFLAGAFVDDRSGDRFDLGAHVVAAEAVAARGGTPVVFPSHGLNEQDEDAWVVAMGCIGAALDRFIGFELGAMFVPYGRIVSLDAYRALLEVRSCVGAKHSSLDRRAEWARLAVRDAVRPDFAVLTGNDLAIDMVVYGSDYLLGLATFAPDHFARRDRWWAEGDPRFAELNDVLQYLGQFCFRPPVPAYRHDAAMFLAIRGWATAGAVPAGAPTRPDVTAERAVLTEIAERLDRLT